MKEQHILYIDILKAIACISVLAGHVIGGIAKAGIDTSGILIHIHTYVYLFHVPCFFFASGYLYANKQVKNWQEYASFVIKKLVILGMPYVACTVLYVAMSSFFSSEMNPNTSYSFREVLNIWRIPIAHYWYLYALIVLFVFIPVVELIFKKVNRIYLWIVFLLLTLWKPNIVWIGYITQYAHLFYMGVIWNISKNSKWKNNLLQYAKFTRGWVYCAENLLLYLIYNIVQKRALLSMELEIILKSIITLLLVAMMIGVSFSITEKGKYIKSFLIWVSKYSLYIYLFHTWFSGTIRVLLCRIGITNCWIQAFIGVLGGFIGPVLLAKFIKSIPMLLFWIEPETVINKRNCKKCFEKNTDY